jgi:hypothetical protein
MRYQIMRFTWRRVQLSYCHNTLMLNHWQIQVRRGPFWLHVCLDCMLSSDQFLCLPIYRSEQDGGVMHDGERGEQGKEYAKTYQETENG